MTTPPTVAEAIALYESVPSLVETDGNASTKTRAAAVEIVRQGADFAVSFPQTKLTTLASGRQIPEPARSITGIKASDIIGQTIAINGQEWPIALAFAIVNAVYIREATKP